MRIERVRFSNLSSLVGEWEIDFADKHFRADGIFAITGVTGAGKTTILDAICLALYGRTPRLGLVTASENAIMSADRGSCHAEVAFSLADGRRANVHWSQKRARGNPAGRLQQPLHEFTDAVTNTPLAKKKTEVADKVTAYIGLEFDQFVRTVMLAQGEFAALLRAEEKDRSKILESLTDTAIYHRLSVACFEQHKAMRARVIQVEEKKTLIAQLANENIDTLPEELAALRGEKQRVEQILTLLGEAISWHKTKAELAAEFRLLEHEQRTLAQEQADFAPRSAQLALAKTARALRPMHKDLQYTRTSAQSLQHRHAELLAAQTAETTKLGAITAARTTAHAELREATHAWQELQPIIAKVQGLDATLVQLEAAHASRNTEHTQKQTGVADAQHACDLALQNLRLGPDSPVPDPVAIRHAIEQLLAGATLHELRQSQDGLRDTAQAYARQHEQLQELRKLLREHTDSRAIQATTQAEKIQATADKTHHEGKQKSLIAERDQAEEELTAIRVVIDLNSLRADLATGKPCPLCGSLEHPWHATAPNHDRLALETAIAKLKQAVEAELKCVRTAASAITQAETRLGILQERQQSLANAIAELQANTPLAELHTEDILGEETLDRAAAALRLAIENNATQLRDLGQRIAAIDEHQATFNKLTSLEKAQTALKTAQIEQQAAARQLSLATQNRAEKRNDRTTLFGTRDPDKENTALQNNIAAAQKTLTSCDTQHASSETALQKLQNDITDTKTQHASTDDACAAQEQAFLLQCEAQGFLTEAEFVAALVRDEELTNLEATAAALHDRVTNLSARTDANRQKLDQHQRQQPKEAERASPELEEQRAATRTEQDRRITAIGRMEQQLQEHEKNAAQLVAIEKELALYAADAQRWTELNELIGSSSGDKFRNFAQSLTFAELVRLANQHLEQFTDRYLLVQQGQMDFRVLDRYHANENRTFKNLSGGETFLVSLAFALGLSQLASRNVRVDSLFLDEGFGTLDEDTLDVALDALSRIPQQGKLIGVISHVESLKARIRTKIDVLQIQNGHSILRGPGCRAINHEG